MVKEFIKSLSNEQVEGEIIKTIFVSLITSFIILAIFYFFKLRYIENFIPKYGFFLFLAILSYAIILPSTRQVRAYKELACMSGMMVGMTIGMIAGLLSGFYIGATNGMFYGSIFGISIGMFFGIWNGKCCGIMGIMEGMMAGFMGGLMGAMTSVMLLNDNVRIMAWIVFAVCTVIMIGLNYMVYKEMREVDGKYGDPSLVIWLTVGLMLLTILVVLYGPRSLLVI